MEVERIFSADQIQIHPDLPEIIKQYTKAVIRANPDDVVEFSWSYFKARHEAAEEEKLAKMRLEAEASSFTDA